MQKAPNLGQTPQFQPYKLSVVKKSRGTSVKLADARFNVKCFENAIKAIDRGLTTNKDGVATIDPLYLAGNIAITIRETKAPPLHQLDDTEYIINLTVDSKTGRIALNNYTSNSNISVSVNNATHTIAVTIQDTLDTPSIVMTKIDKVTKATIGVAQFTVKEVKNNTLNELVVLDRNSEIIPLTKHGKGMVRKYLIEETQIPELYKEYPITVELNVAIDHNGYVVDAWLTDDDADYTNDKVNVQVSGQAVKVTLANEPMDFPKYKVVVTNINAEDKLTRVVGTELNINVEPQIGANVSQTGYTTNNGIYSLGGLNGEGEIVIEISEVNPAYGYESNPTLNTIVINRVIEQWTADGPIYYMTLDEDKTDEFLEVEVDNITREIRVTRYSEPLPSIKIIKVDSNDDSLLQGAKLTVDSIVTNEKEVITNQNGVAIVQIEEILSHGALKFTITEKVPPTGYKRIPEDIVLQVTYDQFDKIEHVSILRGEEYVEVSNDCIGLSVLAVKLKNEKDGIQDPFGVSIIKEDSNNNQIKIPGVYFDVEIMAENGARKKVIKSTNENGVIDISNVEGTGEIEIKLQELQTIQGYELDLEEKIIKLQREVVNKKGKFEVLEVPDGIEVYIDEENETVVIKVRNVLNANMLGIGIVKVDSNDELLKIPNATFEIEDVETGKTYEVVTGDSGSVIGILPIKALIGEYRYIIREKKAPDGYGLRENPIEILVKYSDIGVIESVKMIEGKEFSDIYNAEQNYIEIHISNEVQDFYDMDPYSVTVVKVDSQDLDIRLKDAELSVSVNNEIGQGRLVKQDITDINGEIKINEVWGTGEINIGITEITAPPGRKYDSKVKTAQLKRDEATGRMELIESINVDVVIDNKNNSITLYVRNEPLDELYTLAFTKKDKENQDIKLANAEIVMNLPGQDEDITLITNEEGIATITDLVIPKKGTYTYKIKEIKSPYGYMLIKGNMELKVTFVEDGMITRIESATVEKGKDYLEVEEVLPQYVSLIILNEPDEETLEKPYEFVLLKVDEEDKDIRIQNVEFGIKIFSEDGEQKYINAKTDTEGKITISELIGTGKIEVIIKEISTVEGYEYDGAEKRLVYEVDETTGEIKILEADEDLVVQTTDENMNIEVKLSNQKSLDYFNLHIEKFVSQINEVVQENTEPIVTVDNERKIVSYEKTQVRPVVEYADTIIYAIRVYNDGYAGGYADKIIDRIPEGLEFITESEINKKNAWVLSEDDQYVMTSILSKNTNEENLIEGLDFSTMDMPEYKEVQIEFKVVATKGIEIIENTGELRRQEDENGIEKKPTGVLKQDDESSVEVQVKYFDAEINKYITGIKQEKEGVIKDLEITLDSKNGEIIEIEIDKDDARNSVLLIEYTFEITNKGNKTGKVEQIIDELPEGLKFYESDNPGWIKDGNIAIYELNENIEPGQKIEIKILLRAELEDVSLGHVKNTGYIVAEEDIDTIVGEDGNNNSDTEFTDNSPNPEDPGNNPDPEDPGNNPDPEDPGNNPDPEDPGNNPDPEDPGNNPDPEDPGNNPDPEDPGNNPDPGNPGNNPNQGNPGSNGGSSGTGGSSSGSNKSSSEKNSSSSDLVVTVKTGKEGIVIYYVLTLSVLGILAVGIVLIKKYVLKS